MAGQAGGMFQLDEYDLLRMQEGEMKDRFLRAGVMLGMLGVALLFLSYVMGCRMEPDLADGIIVFLSACAICGGMKVCYLAWMDPALGLEQNDRTIVFLGGAVVVWVSLHTILKTILQAS